MAFRNETTYARAVAEGREECYHQTFERAAARWLDNARGPPTIYPNHIGGISQFSDRTFRVLSPGDNDLVVGLFQRSTVEDVNRAIASARDTFIEWSREDWTSRVRIFQRAAELLRQRKYELAAAITLDCGKNRHEAMGEVDEAIDFLEYCCSEVRRTNGFERITDPAYPDEESRAILRPYGVWAIICPFNFPLAITAGMTTGALITGNTVVVKPSSAAPLMVRLFHDILVQAGLPPGVLNLVAGGGEEVGSALAHSRDVDGVAFTGSREVGMNIMRSSPVEVQRPIIAEMGSKNPIIVSGEADLEEAAEGVVAAAFSFSGQKCSACSRLYVHESVYDAFLLLLLERTAKLKVGDPFDRSTDIGPLITDKALYNHLKWAGLARRDGKISVGGTRAEGGALSRGFYAMPTVVEGLPETHELMRRELFVPILGVQRYRTLQGAVEMANATEFGLTAGIFSNSEAELKHFFDNMQFGVLYANRRRSGTTGAMVGAQAFAGWKGSGSTGHGTGSTHYLLQFMREQSRTVVRR